MAYRSAFSEIRKFASVAQRIIVLAFYRKRLANSDIFAITNWVFNYFFFSSAACVQSKDHGLERQGRDNGGKKRF